MGLQSASGGLTKSKLELATAVPGDVVAGKTFYAGDKELQTGLIPNYGHEPLGSKCGTYNPGDGVRFYIYLPNADTDTESQGGFLTRSVCINANTAANRLKNDGIINATCVWAGRCWANGVANGSGWNDDTFSYRRYNSGERIGYKGPGGYGNLRVAFVSI